MTVIESLLSEGVELVDIVLGLGMVAVCLLAAAVAAVVELVELVRRWQR